MTNNKDLKFDGQKNQVKGKIREVIGVVTDNDSEQLKGKAQSSLGKAEVKVSDAVKKAKQK